MAEPIFGAPDESVTPPATPAAPDPQADLKALNTKIVTKLKTQIEETKHVRGKLFSVWKQNVNQRLGRMSDAGTESIDVGDQTSVNYDWPLTKTKIANLYSQVPEVQGTHENEQYAPAVAPFMKALNYELGPKRLNIAVPMQENLADLVNAAGVGAALVGYAARFVDVPDTMTPPTPENPAPTIPQVASDRFFINRISPNDLLWPKSFTGSDFEDADWVGCRRRKPWPEAQAEFRLKDEQKDEAVSLGGLDRESQTLQAGTNEPLSDEAVIFSEVYYWRYRFDAKEPSFKAIWKLVVIDGIKEPVYHAPWKGQLPAQTGYGYAGSCVRPIQVVTLTYVTDNPIPPSDTYINRPQVLELQQDRRDMADNRRFSRPLRWYDTNRIDPVIGDRLMAGDWQGMIPSKGDGTRSIGEIARASYPAENMEFARVSKADLMEGWQTGANQMGLLQMGEKRTATEVRTSQGNFSTVVGLEQWQVARYFLRLVECLAGQMALYSDFPTLTPEERQTIEQVWDPRHVPHDLVLDIRPDSTVRLDSQTRIDRLMGVLNMLVKSGYINPLPIITEIVELSGLDPTKVVIQPQPAPPEPPKISFGFSGAADLANPMVLATLIHEGKAPTEQELKQAVQMLMETQQAVSASMGLAPAGPPPMPGPPVAGMLPPPNGNGVVHPDAIVAHPTWELGGRIAKRTRDVGGE